VCNTLNFRGGTKKSHLEQQARDALMGRPIKKGSAIVNGATLHFVKPFTVVLPCCTYDKWGRPVPRWRKGSSTLNGATPYRVAPLMQASQNRVKFWNSFKLGSFCVELSVKGHFCRFRQGNSWLAGPAVVSVDGGLALAIGMDDQGSVWNFTWILLKPTSSLPNTF
jgi:hypothetical protein